MIELTSDQIASIKLAAIGAAGSVSDPEFEANVVMAIEKIVPMFAQGSEVDNTINRLVKAKVFTGHVVGIQKESSSTRGVVKLYTGTSKSHKNCEPGFEQVRTDRTDTPSGLAMARKIRNLIGHRILIRVFVDQFVNKTGDNVKVRVVVGVEDLGISDNPDAKAALKAKQAADALKAKQAG